MASITDKLFELEASLEEMVDPSAKEAIQNKDRSDIVSHLDYVIELLGTMVSKETFAKIKDKAANGFNGIADRIATIDDLVGSGEMSGGGSSGDMDKLIDRTITEVNSNAESIGEFAFAMCTNLTTVNLPECETIGGYAFVSCNNIEHFNIGKFSGAFGFNSGPESFPLTNIKTVKLPSCSCITGSRFKGCSLLTEIDIRGCEYIENDAFNGCYNLKSLYLPNCSKIEATATFSSCSSLSELYMLSTSMTTLSLTNQMASPFIQTPLSSGGTGGSIYVRASLVSEYMGATGWKTVSDRIVGLTDEEIEALDF